MAKLPKIAHPLHPRRPKGLRKAGRLGSNPPNSLPSASQGRETAPSLTQGAWLVVNATPALFQEVKLRSGMVVSAGGATVYNGMPVVVRNQVTGHLLVARGTKPQAGTLTLTQGWEVPPVYRLNKSQYHADRGVVVLRGQLNLPPKVSYIVGRLR